MEKIIKIFFSILLLFCMVSSAQADTSSIMQKHYNNYNCLPQKITGAYTEKLEEEKKADENGVPLPTPVTAWLLGSALLAIAGLRSKE